jgi:hypothetical protein
MKLKSKWDHHQGRNQAWKSAIKILQVILLKWHIINFFKLKKSENFTTSTYSILASTIKISANFLTFWAPSEVSKIAERYVYFFENCVHMRIEGAWGMASCGREE